MKSQLLIETLSPGEASLVESQDGSKNIFLSGRFMTGGEKNGNGRIYPVDEIQKVVEGAMARIKSGESLMGELNHPDNLSINLANVSHVITELKMDGSFAIGKAKILNTPAGNIAKGLLEGGVRLGVSSRGTGNVVEGNVSDFNLVTVDIVATPSGPGCYPDMVRESMEDTKILSLAEAVIHDPKAQKYFKSEMEKFIANVFGKK
jgi:hypothetical protein